MSVLNLFCNQPLRDTSRPMSGTTGAAKALISELNVHDTCYIFGLRIALGLKDKLLNILPGVVQLNLFLKSC